MEIDDRLIRQFEALLARDESDRPTPRLIHDARRLAARARALAPRAGIVQPDLHAIALACLALQLPMRTVNALAVGKFGQINLRERCAQAAELLVTLFKPHVDAGLLERTTRLLNDLPVRSTPNVSARLLADTINLEDFGLIGLFGSAMLAASRGHGIDVVIEGHRMRDAYGYWEARLRDGFHFAAIRAIAERRLDAARSALKSLEHELREEGLP